MMSVENFMAFFRPFQVLFVSAADWKVIISCQTSLDHSLQYSCCKFLESCKQKANSIYVMDFASVELFFVTYIGLYCARKCKNQQTCKQTVKQLSLWQRCTHHIICHHMITFFGSVIETNNACSGLMSY